MSEDEGLTIRPPSATIALMVGKIMFGTLVILCGPVLLRSKVQSSSDLLWFAAGAYVAVAYVTFAVFRSLFSLRIGPTGVCRGIGRVWVEWESIRKVDAEAHPLLGTTYLIRSATRPTLQLLASVANNAFFLRALERWAPAGNPLRQLVDTKAAPRGA